MLATPSFLSLFTSIRHVPSVAVIGGGLLLGLVRPAGNGLWNAVFGFVALAGVLIVSRWDASRLLPIWLATTPFLSFYARYPEAQSVITYDRVCLVCLAIIYFRDVRTGQSPGGCRFGLFETAWIVFCGLMLLDLFARPGSSVYAWKIGVDGFVFPMVAFMVARRGVRMESQGWWPSVALSLLAGFLLLVGVYELFTRHDLFPYPGSGLISDGFVRANGPFVANHSFAMISVIIGLLLWYWPVLSPRAESTAQRQIRQTAGVVAALASCIPLFRVFWFTTALCTVVTGFLHFPRNTFRRRPILLGSGLILLLLLTLGIGKWAAGTLFFQMRVASPENLYTRLATYEAAATVFSDHWLNGVGLTRYTEEYNRLYYDEDDYNRKYPTFGGEKPRNSPHNTLLLVLAELGVVSGIVYGVAQVVLLFEGLLLWRSGQPRKRAAGRLLMLLWCVYWIPGMTLSSGYYPDLNLFFFTACGLTLGAARREA